MGFREIDLSTGEKFRIPTSGGRNAKWVTTGNQGRTNPFVRARWVDKQGMERFKNFPVSKHKDEKNCWIRAREWLEGIGEEEVDPGPVGGSGGGSGEGAES